MDRERDIIHAILDGDAGEEENRRMARSMETDARLRDESRSLEDAVRMLEKSERIQPPPYFTADVMRRLPSRPLPVLDRFKTFVFGTRVLRWNLASALAVAAIVIIALVSVVRLPRETTTTVAEGPAESAVLVRLTFYAPQAQRVAVAGEFNKWRTDADEMRRSDGVWNIDLKLKPGVYAYSFIVDGRSWVPDPGAESYADDGFGSRNAVLRVDL
jgi:anti-sigma factor RsiW